MTIVTEFNQIFLNDNKKNMAIVNFVSMILHYYIQQNNRWTNQSIFSTKIHNHFKIKNTLNI